MRKQTSWLIVVLMAVFGIAIFTLGVIVRSSMNLDERRTHSCHRYLELLTGFVRGRIKEGELPEQALTNAITDLSRRTLDWDCGNLTIHANPDSKAWNEFGNEQSSTILLLVIRHEESDGYRITVARANRQTETIDSTVIPTWAH